VKIDRMPYRSPITWLHDDEFDSAPHHTASEYVTHHTALTHDTQTACERIATLTTARVAIHCRQ